MARKILSEEEKERKLMMKEFLKGVKIKTPEDLNNLFKNMLKDFVEECYQGEIEEELGYTKYDYRNKDTDNSRNGYSTKNLKTSMGEIDVSIPRDRNGNYEPQLIKKHQNTIGQDLEAKIISMYAKGMTTNDIESHINEIYGYELSDSAISRITDKILPIAKEWQNRPLDPVYAVVFLESVFPKTEIQQCIIHQIRNTTQFVSYKDIKALITDLKLVYKATSEEMALEQLEIFDAKWGQKYPKIAISWRNNWTKLSTYFKYPQEIRTLIYTTNAIEGFNRQLRKVTKNKTIFPTDDSLLKFLLSCKKKKEDFFIFPLYKY